MINNEDKFLLYCIQSEFSNEAVQKIIKLVKSSLNWDEVLRSAFWHGIAPFVYHTLEKIQDIEQIPKDVKEQLKKAYFGNLARNIGLYGVLRQVLEEFHKKEIEVIVLKGAFLADFIYGDIGLRKMGDIDILVKKNDVFTAEKIISELGYQFSGDNSPQWYRENMHHIVYLHPKNKIPIEIHWHISQKSHPSRLNLIHTDIMEHWWKRCQIVELSGVKTFSLCPEDLIFYLCHHFVKHRFIFNQDKNFRDKGFSNIGALLQLTDIYYTFMHYRNELNWTVLHQEYKKYGMEVLIQSTLGLIAQLMDAHTDFFPSNLNETKQLDFDEEVITLIQKRIFLKPDDNIMPVPYGFLRSVGKNKLKNITIALRKIFPRRQELAQRYSLSASSARLNFYYLIHPLKLLLKYKNTLSSVTRLKEDVILNKWLGSDK